MIGIVVVSHSHALAVAAVDLACEMVPPPTRPTVLMAAGLDDTTFGTDATAIADAITQADSPDGVLIMVDLGSAILSAEMALDFVDPDLAGRCVISPAPLVEGLVAAVVTASSNAPLTEVAQEAARGLAAKQEQLGGVESAATVVASQDEAGVSDESVNPSAAESTPQPTVGSVSEPNSTSPTTEPISPTRAGTVATTGGTVTGTTAAGDTETGGTTAVITAGTAEDDALVFTCTINNPHGLHARPAAALVASLRGIDAHVCVTNLTGNHQPVSGASLTSILMLNLKQGDELQARITGPEAERAYDQLTALAQTDFGETANLTP